VFGSGGARNVPGDICGAKEQKPLPEKGVEQYTEFCKILCKRVEDLKTVQIVIEPLRPNESNIINYVWQGMQIVREVNHPRLQELADIFHMICGIVIKIVNCIKAGDWAAAIFDNFAWILIVLGAVSLIAVPSLSTVGAVIAVIGVVLVLFFAGRSRPNFGKRLVKGAGSLYDVTSYISDTLSYARIFALGMATGVMGSVFNTLASMLYSGKHGVMFAIFLVLAMVLLVALHAFSMVINVLGTFVHTARLQYIEYFGKFYESGGRAFQPLAYRTKNVRITK